MDIHPFSFLVETQEYPWARTLRTSVTQKMSDTFVVFAGKVSHSVQIEQELVDDIQWFGDATAFDKTFAQVRLGLFDYATLGLPYLISWGLARLIVSIQTVKQEQQTQTDLFIYTMFLTYMLEYPLIGCYLLWNTLIHGIARLFVGGAGLFFLGLLIGLSFAYLSEWYAKTIKEEAFSLKGEDVVSVPSYSDDNLIDLKKFLLDDKTQVIRHGFLDSEQYKCELHNQNGKYYLKISYPNHRKYFYAEINEQNIHSLDCLLKLNFANVVNVLMIQKDTLLAAPQSSTWAQQSRFFRAADLSTKHQHAVGSAYVSTHLI